ncbi:thiolase C-terminal domain-containing protein [Halorussus salinisoli]|uniref:thiolase C-terminal domain-containing protein n=1 Tax=Halorussus salinisoli TaxID=2558242 RepID=UPI0010C182D2|nr:beta-ketoacyl synthase N-terminal-like domain-containing protein [Halorussus salinisoli]
MNTGDVTIAGVGNTPFTGGTDSTLVDLAAAAATDALSDADIDGDEVNSLHVGNMLAESTNRRAGLANALASALGLEAIRATRIENTSASGASAVHHGVESISSGRSETALVVGVEQMTSRGVAEVTDAISRLVHEREYEQGLTLPAFAGLAADAYLNRHGADRESLARVAVKNHRNAVENSIAQYRETVAVEDVLDSPLVASPLRLYDCCPMSNGAAALVLDSDCGDVAVTAVASATGTHAVAERRDPLEVESVRVAGKRAFDAAGCRPKSIDVACVHDAFTILEWLELEELGFYDNGTAWRATVDGETAVDGALPVNPGGGLKARGHPLGATGVAQLVELVWQLRGDVSPSRRVDGARRGLAVNVAGFGNNSVCTVLET